MPKLRSVNGEHIGREWPLGAKPILIGRRETNAIVLAHNKASRSHAEVGVKGNRAYIKDLQSSNGTFLNGIKLGSGEARLLSPGDEVRVGGTSLRYFESDTSLPDIDIPGHELIEVIAEGGMGTIYRARQTSMDRDVAVKILNPDYARRENYVKRFIQEARSAGKLNHPNIIQVHNVGMAGTGVHYFTMELVRGQNLTQRMVDKDSLTLEVVLDAAEKVADALDYAHERGIIHRDIKPENIVIADSGEVKLADLGIATSRHIPESGSRKRVLGTPHYMSPEQATGKPVDGRSDLYSLGATLFHVIAGEPVFDHPKSTEVMTMHIKNTPPALAKIVDAIPASVCELVDKLLAKDPAERYATAGEVRDAIRELLPNLDKEKARAKTKPKRRRTTGSKSPSTAPGGARASAAESRHHEQMIKMIVAGGIAVAVMIVALVSFTQDDSTPGGGGTGGGTANQSSSTSADRRALQQARELVRREQYEQAKPILNRIVEATSDNAMMSEAMGMLRDINAQQAQQSQAAETEQALSAAWQDFEDARNQDASRVGLLRDKLNAIREQFPEEADRVDQQLAILAEAENNALEAAKRDAESQIRLQKYDTAISRVDAFKREHPRHPGLPDLDAVRQKALTTAQKALEDLKKKVQELEAEKRYDAVLSAVASFQKNVEFASAQDELDRLRSTSEAKIRDQFNLVKETVREHLLKLEFPEARNALSARKLLFIGLAPFDKQADDLDAMISGVERLHTKVVSLIQQSDPWRVTPEFGIESLEGKAVIGASKDELQLKLGPASTRKKWLDLKDNEMIAVYRRYLPADAPEQKYLESFARMMGGASSSGRAPANTSPAPRRTASPPKKTGGNTSGGWDSW